MNTMLKISLLCVSFQICNSSVFASENALTYTPGQEDAHFGSLPRSRGGMETSSELRELLMVGLSDISRMQRDQDAAEEEEYRRDNASLLRISRAAGTVAGAAGATIGACSGAGAGFAVAERLKLSPSLVLVAGAAGAIGGGVLGYDQSRQQGAVLVMQVASAGTQVAEQYRELSPEKKAVAAGMVFCAVGAAAILLGSK